MARFGCEKVIIGESVQERLRPQWRQLLTNTSRKDTIKRKPTRRQTLKSNLKINREKTVVNMYNSGYSIDDIWKASGYKSRTNIFRVLNRAGVQLNRGPHSGPIKRHNKKKTHLYRGTSYMLN